MSGVGVALFGLFHYVPMAGLVVAFKDFTISRGIWGSPWNGLDNFVRLFEGEEFSIALRNTLIISVLRLSIGFVAPIVLALLLSELRVGLLRRGVQTASFIPYLLSWVILGGISLMVFAQEGPLNRMTAFVGCQPVSFLTDGKWFLTVLIATGIWQNAGYGAVIYLAALAGISPTLYEAAVIDGANRWQVVRFVTMPALAPTILVLFILNLGHILDAGFDQVYNLYNPLVYDVADIIDTYVLRRMISLDFGLSAAAGMFKSVVGFVLIYGANWTVRRLSSDTPGLW